MHGHALATFAFVLFCGLLRPLEWRASRLLRAARWAPTAVERPWDASPDPASALPTRLNAIELALIAEYSLEMARANEAVADDATKGLETRRRASEVAAAWRHRAQVFQAHARRASAHPTLPDERPVRALARAYIGPERRQGMRRRQMRRTDPASTPSGHARGDRRAGSERRRRDRRRRQLAPR